MWAGSTGTPSCGTTLTPGTLNSQQAQYTQTYAYDVLNRLTQGPLGTGYSYGDSTHLDAVTSATGYSANYDAAGDMTGRNGNVLGYDALRRLVTWQNTATNPTQTASYAYDGSGNRVQQAVTSGGTTTTTSYIGSYEEVSVTGGTTTTTKYYSAGVASVVNVNGVLTYLVADALSSVSVALTAAGGVQATNLYSPYGSVRYTNGTMPTSYGYTKMRQDPSGLSYDQARYYDASVGQFISADMKQGENRYGYVAGNPETLTDPTGNNICSDDPELCKPKRPAPTPPPLPPCTRNCGSTGGGGCGGCKSYPPTTQPTKPTDPPCDVKCQREKDLASDEKWIKTAKNVQTLENDATLFFVDATSALLAFIADQFNLAATAGASAVSDLVTLISDVFEITGHDIGPFWHNVLAGVKFITGVVKFASILLSWWNPFQGAEEKAEGEIKDAAETGII